MAGIAYTTILSRSACFIIHPDIYVSLLYRLNIKASYICQLDLDPISIHLLYFKDDFIITCQILGKHAANTRVASYPGKWYCLATVKYITLLLCKRVKHIHQAALYVSE